MKTLNEIKAEILATNPSRTYSINDEEFEQTEAEFQEAVTKRAQMEFEQLQAIEAKKAEYAIKVSAYEKLGLSQEEIDALLPKKLYGFDE